MQWTIDDSSTEILKYSDFSCIGDWTFHILKTQMTETAVFNICSREIFSPSNKIETFPFQSQQMTAAEAIPDAIFDVFVDALSVAKSNGLQFNGKNNV